MASIARYIARSGIMALFFVKPIMSKTYVASLNAVVLAQILVFALALSQLVRVEGYYRYLVPGVVLLSFYTTIYSLLQDVFFFATRAEVYLYTYVLPLPRYMLAIGFTLAVSIMCIPLYIPYIAFLAIASPHAGSPTGVLISIASIAAMMVIFSIAVGGLLASIYMSIKSNWRLLLVVFLLSDILGRFSTAYYPFSYLPEVYRYIAIANPLTHFINLCLTIIGVDPMLLIDPGFSAAVLTASVLGFTAITILGAQRFAEGGRLV
ncbi:MAG: hypothetical protein QXW41_07610 [Fervidicoccaceae archaeon]